MLVRSTPLGPWRCGESAPSSSARLLATQTNVWIASQSARSAFWAILSGRSSRCAWKPPPYRFALFNATRTACQHSRTCCYCRHVVGTSKTARCCVLKAFRLAHGRIGSSPKVEVAIASLAKLACLDTPDAARIARDDWKAVAGVRQGLVSSAAKGQRSVLDLLSSGPDPRAVSPLLTAMKQAKVEGLNAIYWTNSRTGRRGSSTALDSRRARRRLRWRD